MSVYFLFENFRHKKKIFQILLTLQVNSLAINRKDELSDIIVERLEVYRVRDAN